MNTLVAATLTLLAVTATLYVCYLALYAWVCLLGLPADKQDWETSFSIVHPTYNEEKIVETKLDDLLVQDRDTPERYGIYGKVVLPFNGWFIIVSPWLLMATLVGGTGAVSLFGVGALVFLIAVVGFAYLSQNDWFGSVQALYSVFDTQISLLRASIELLGGKADGTWEVDTEFREAFE